jgi:hypothetical protein
MKKDFIISKIEAPQDGSQYVFITFIDPNEPMSSGGGGAGSGYPQILSIKAVKQYHLPLQKT